MPEASPATGASESAEVKTPTESAAQSVSQDVMTASSTVTQTDAKPESSPGQADKPASMLDAIKAVSQKTAAASPAAEGDQSKSANAAQDGSQKDQESEEELPEDPTDEELARYHSKTRRRVNMLKTQRDEARGKLKEVEPAVEGWNTITSYMNQHQLTGDEVNMGFGIMAAMKGDPFKAKEMLAPYWNALCQLTGDGDLPQDLKKDVDDGRIEERHAREIAASRTKVQVADTRRQHVESTTAQRDAQQAQVAATDQIRTAVSSWEAQWQGKDADYAVKQPRVMEKFKLGLLSGQVQVRTPQDAVAFVERCRQEVEDELKRFVPKRTAVSPINGVAATTGSRPKPTSMIEAMRQATGR